MCTLMLDCALGNNGAGCQAQMGRGLTPFCRLVMKLIFCSLGLSHSMLTASLNAVFLIDKTLGAPWPAPLPSADCPLSEGLQVPGKAWKGNGMRCHRPSC